MNVDLILKLIGAGVVLIVVVLGALVLTGVAKIELKNTETGKTRKWPKE